MVPVVAVARLVMSPVPPVAAATVLRSDEMVLCLLSEHPLESACFLFPVNVFFQLKLPLAPDFIA